MRRTSSNCGYAQVCVIGAGISGLQCAQNLKAMGVDVMVLEAADYIGGRIRQDDTFIEGIKVDVGAEMVHGNGTVLYDLLDKLDQPMQKLFIWAHGDGGPLAHKVEGGYGLYYVGNEKKVLRYDVSREEDADFFHVNDVLSNLGDAFEGGRAYRDHRTLEQFLLDSHVSHRMLGMANAGFANTLCSDISILSFARTSRFALCWNADGDEADYRLPFSFAPVINHLKQGLDIRVNTPITQIDYSNPDEIVISSSNNQSFCCQRVVVTVPVNILRDKDIRFTPPLPLSKTSAIDGIRMERAMKVILTFHTRFFPKNLHGMICADSPIPECWFREFTSDSLVRPRDPRIACYAVAYVTSKFADALAPLGKDAAIATFLRQLDEMFCIIGNDEHQLDKVMTRESDTKNPASRAFLNGFVFDWAEQPFVRGGYGCPLHGYPVDCPERLAAPVRDRLFFAGEATCSGGATTAHAAMGTGMRASQEVAVSLIRVGEFSVLEKAGPHIRSRL